MVVVKSQGEGVIEWSVVWFVGQLGWEDGFIVFFWNFVVYSDLCGDLDIMMILGDVK